MARKVRRWIALAAAVLAAGALLNIVTGHTVAGAKASSGATTRVSVGDDGSQETALNGFFNPGSRNAAFSGDGRFVAFDTNFPFDLVDKDNDTDPTPQAPATHESDVYVRDRAGNHTVLISRGTPPPIVRLRAVAAAAVNGEAGANGDSRDPSISADGRYVAFTTSASNIHTVNPTSPSPDALHTEIVICDRDPDNDTVLDEHVGGSPKRPMDYAYTVVSRVTTVVGPDPNPEDPFPGPTLRTNSASQPSLTIGAGFGEVAWVDSRTGSEPPPDRVVVTRFALGATGLVQSAGMEFADTSPGRVVRDAGDAGEPVLSRDGSHVAYTVNYDLGETSGRALADGHLGELKIPTPTLVTPGFFFTVVDQSRLDIASSTPGGEGNVSYLGGTAYSPTVSRDGRLVAFTEWTLNPDNTTSPDIVLIDRDPDADGAFVSAGIGGTNNGEPVSSGVVSHDNAGGRGGGYSSALTPDGRYIAFSTDALNMHNGVDNTSPENPCNIIFDFAAADVPSCTDLVVRDLTVDADRAAAKPPLPRLPGELASPSVRNDCGAPTPDDTCEGNGFNRGASIADDGSAVAYESSATDLLPGGADSNGLNDIYLREFRPTVTGDPVDFGTVDVGTTASQTAVVRHAGFGPLRVDSVTLSGQHAGDFKVLVETCTSAPLFETGTCGVSLQFTATVPGPRTATLTVTPHGRTPISIPITAGVGVPPDGFRASPNPMNFGQRLPLSPSGPATLTVSNAGRVPFTIESISLPTGRTLFPKDYIVRGAGSPNPCIAKKTTLPPAGGKCTLTVTFNPHGPGTRNAAVQITTSQLGASSPFLHLIALNGSAPAQAAQVNPGVVTTGRVGAITGQGFPPNHTVTLTITDFGTLTAQTGADGSFTQTMVVFQHTTQGSRTVTATVPGTTVKVTTTVLVVSGTFQPPDFVSRR